MPDIDIPSLKGQALGYTVYRGHIVAREIYPALWIDRFDEHDNPNGYQRPHDPRRSKLAAEYAIKVHGAFWYEAILNVRIKGTDRDEKIGDPDLGIPEGNVGFEASAREYPNFGTLRVQYTAESKRIGGETVPWNRAFSVVDSQHRLLGLENSEIVVPVCIFTGLTRKQEAIIFKDINDNQKPMPTKLVNNILLRTEGPLARPDSAIARRLHDDAASPFHGRVDLGGAKRQGQIYFTSLEGLRGAVEEALGEYLEPITNPRVATSDREQQLDRSYQYIRNFWRAVVRVWPSSWDLSPVQEPRPREKYTYRKYKLLTTTGIGGLSGVAYEILKQKCIPEDDISEDFILGLLNVAKGFDWDKDSRDMQGVAGPGGARLIFKALRDIILPVKI